MVVQPHTIRSSRASCLFRCRTRVFYLTELFPKRCSAGAFDRYQPKFSTFPIPTPLPGFRNVPPYEVSGTTVIGNVSPPSSYAMDLIRQVKYDLEFDEHDNDGMLDVYEFNTLKLKHESRSHWRRFPAAYFTFLSRPPVPFRTLSRSLRRHSCQS